MTPRYQATPVARDQKYALRPDSARRDAWMCAKAIAVLFLLAFLGSLKDVQL